jgi:chromosome segregation ATPase
MVLVDVMAEQDAWSRVYAVLDQMVGERERLNRYREKAQEADKPPGPEQFMPTSREVNEALQARYGKGMSYRDLGPLVQRYIHENDALRRLRPRAGQRYQETAEATVEALPKRIRAGVDRVFGALEAQRERLTALLADQVASETEALQRRIGALEECLREQQYQLADQDVHVDDADRALATWAAAVSERDRETERRIAAEAVAAEAKQRAAAAVEDAERAHEERAAAVSTRDAEMARRMAAEAVAAEAEQRAAAATRERDAAVVTMHAIEETHRVIQARYDELMAHAARLSGELERSGREREEYRQQIADLNGQHKSAKRSYKGDFQDPEAGRKMPAPEG